MRAIVDNGQITVYDITPDFEQYVVEALSYTDKAAQYSLRKLGRTMYGRKSPQYQQLQNKVNGCLAKIQNVVDNGKHTRVAILPSACIYLISNIKSVVDNRTDTGTKIALPWVNKPYSPRDYQEDTINLLISNYRGIANLATGLGKTLIAIHTIHRIKKKTLIVCPTDSIAKQFYSELVKAFGETKVGFYGGGKKKIKDITVGIAASVSKDIAILSKNNFGLVIFDECHHTPATTFFTISDGLKNVGRMFGLTATDFRSDGKDVLITAGCGEVLIRRDIIWGVQNKWLAQPYFIVRNVNTTTQPQYKEDKIKNYKAHVLNCQAMKDQIRNDIQNMLNAGKSVLCLVDEVAHGIELSNQLGIPFATGKDKQSQQYVDDLNAGKIPGLIGTDGKVGEGTDTKKVDVLVLANFVASKGPVIQAIGRGLRIYPGKEICYILDYIPTGSDMLMRHSLGRIKLYKSITDKVKVV